MIGPEAGGGKDLDEVYRRARVWLERGRRETEDLHGYHVAIEIDSTIWVPTWGGLIKVMLAFKAQSANSVDKKRVSEFQSSELGKSSGQNAVLDLSQLSSPTTKVWILDQFGFSWLKTKKIYQRAVVPARRQRLKALVTKHKPKVVLFYGLNQVERTDWGKTFSVKFEPSQKFKLAKPFEPAKDCSPDKKPQLWYAHSEATLFAALPHPTGLYLKGAGELNRFFAELGVALRQEVEDLRAQFKQHRG
jgi:hypothetical protein